MLTVNTLQPAILEQKTLSYPSLCLVTTFNPKMYAEAAIKKSLKYLFLEAERLLLKSYEVADAVLLMEKLRKLLSRLNYHTLTQSIAVSISATAEKIMYMNMPVKQHVSTGCPSPAESIVHNKLHRRQFLVLALAETQGRLYSSDKGVLTRVMTSTPEAGTVKGAANGIAFNNLISQLDQSLDILLPAYRLPLFICGPEKLLGPFRLLSRHFLSATAYIPASHPVQLETDLALLLLPYITDWKKLRETALLNELAQATLHGNISTGLDAVWQNAMHRRGGLLVLERNCLAQPPGSDKKLEKIIEQVAAHGGDVELAGKGVLSNFQHIAFIHNY
ncbi:hypothetical protein [Foetidibacter luteolus]|uniref:hypothetical protein n=1 Tax=Foetidibacter luteolus TaxID=2608880 RepID=UPI00129A17EE|nr:hypothetical protein [Foetidibacter luteolus]